MASCFFKELQADALNWLSGYLQGCECVCVYVCMCKLTLIDLQDEEVVVSSLYLRSGSFVPDFYKIHTGFLLCTPCVTVGTFRDAAELLWAWNQKI